jgi:SAM-dependent methyltransferase
VSPLVRSCGQFVAAHDRCLPPTQVVAPYRGLAATYDSVLGLRFFRRVRTAFERLQPEYGFVFRSAADLGCGTGLFARYLAREWRVPVFAVDRSPAMLEQARRTCCGERVRLLLQDLRQLRLPRQVDLIAANCDVLNHLVSPSEFRQTLHRVRDNLTPGGHFYFDLITPSLGLPPGRWTGWTQPTPHGLVHQCLLWEPRQRLLRIDVVHRRFDHCRAQVEHHTERAYSLAQVAQWLAEAGFVLRGVHDDTTLDFSTTCTPRVIILARKRPDRVCMG